MYRDKHVQTPDLRSELRCRFRFDSPGPCQYYLCYNVMTWGSPLSSLLPGLGVIRPPGLVHLQATDGRGEETGGGYNCSQTELRLLSSDEEIVLVSVSISGPSEEWRVECEVKSVLTPSAEMSVKYACKHYHRIEHSQARDSEI